MDEDQTRKKLVDKALRETGWDITDYREAQTYDTVAVREYPTKTGPADYLLYCKGEALAAVEAKKLALGPQNVLSQAQRYARGFEDGKFRFGEFRLPFIYSTNGELFWFQDSSRSNQSLQTGCKVPHT